MFPQNLFNDTCMLVVAYNYVNLFLFASQDSLGRSCIYLCNEVWEVNVFVNKPVSAETFTSRCENCLRVHSIGCETSFALSLNNHMEMQIFNFRLTMSWIWCANHQFNCYFHIQCLSPLCHILRLTFDWELILMSGLG